MGGNSVRYILKEINALDKNDREAIVGLAKGLLTEGMDSSDVRNILEEINALDKNDREAIAGLAKGLLTEGMGGNSVRYILKGINALDKNDREAIVGLAKGFVTEGMDGYSVRNILKGINALDKNDREAIVGLAKGLLTEGMDGYSVCNILEGINALDKNDREAIVGLAKEFVTEEMSSNSVCNIFEGINALDKDDREAIVGLAKEFVTEEMSSNSVCNIFEGINALKDDREAIVGLAKEFVTEEMSSNSVCNIFEGINALKDDREAIVRLAKEFVTEEMSSNSVCKILEGINALDKDNREAVVNNLKPFITLMAKVSFIKILFNLSTKTLKDEEEPQGESNDKLLMVCDKMLDNEKNGKMVSKVSRLILENLEYFGLCEESPIVQKAITRKIDTKNLSDPKNKYVVYKFLYDSQKNELPDLLLKPSENGLVLNPHAFLSIARLPKSRDLPKNISPKVLINLFDNCQLSDKKCREITANSLSFLRKNFTQDKHLAKLLSPSKNKYITLAAYQFSWLIHYVNNLPDESRDETLLQHSASIQMCPKGKEEGIAAIFHTLPLDSKGLLYANSNGHEAVRSILQSVINQILSSESSFMIEMTGKEPPIAELAHQSTFLRNLIGNKVGLETPLCFDEHTSQITDALIKRSFKEVYTSFFKHLTPKLLISKFCLFVNRDIASDKTLYSHLTALIDDSDINKAWKIEGKNVFLTEFGASVILKKTKLIYASDPSTLF